MSMQQTAIIPEIDSEQSNEREINGFDDSVDDDLLLRENNSHSKNSKDENES